MTTPIEALWAILAEPYGCAFCDSGELRNPAKPHETGCGFRMARAAITAAEKAEPVAWQYRVSERDGWLTVALPLPKTPFSFEWRPLYPAPQAEKAEPVACSRRCIDTLMARHSRGANMTTITDTQAMDALESLDDYARMDIGVAPTGPYRTLRKFILQHATTVGLADMTRAALEKASAQPAAQKAEPVAKREVLIPYGWTLTPDNLQSVWPENVSCVIEGTLSSVRTTGAREHQTISQLDAQLDHFMKMAGIEGWQAWQMRAFMDAARTQSAEEVESVAPITPLALAQGALIHAISRSASGAANAGDLRRAIRALFGDEVDAKLASFLLTT